MEYGGELVKQLMDCSTKHEKLHEKFHHVLARSGEGENETALCKLMAQAAAESGFFDKAKAWLFENLQY